MFEQEDLFQSTDIDDDDWCRGPREAPIVMLEYGDFECPYCALARGELESLIEDYPQTFRLVFRHFPLTTLHRDALLAAEVAEAAGAQAKFWEMHDVLFAHYRQLEYAHLHRFATALQLDMNRFEHDITAHRYLDAVREDIDRGVKDGVNGTPTLFINGRRYDGPRERVAILTEVADRLPRGVREHAMRLLDGHH